jgi:hypothetical protein
VQRGTPAIEGRLLPNDWLTIMQGVSRAVPWRLKVADVSPTDTGPWSRGAWTRAETMRG